MEDGDSSSTSDDCAEAIVLDLESRCIQRQHPLIVQTTRRRRELELIAIDRDIDCNREPAMSISCGRVSLDRTSRQERSTVETAEI